MKIITVIVTFNRLPLLKRALESVNRQSREPDEVIVISNSEKENTVEEDIICHDFGHKYLVNKRTGNYAGGLNTGIEDIIKRMDISDDIFIATLDDDDVWLPEYLNEIETSNNEDYDLIAAAYLRYSNDENLLMVLPNQLSENDFLTGNPGIGGSNTFIRLTTLLKAGCFDEALHSSVDRDFFVRVFAQEPRYKVINKHLVTAYTDKNRERLTTNRSKKIISLKIFLYKYQYLMNSEQKEQFFQRAGNYFSIERSELETVEQKTQPIIKSDINFNNKGNYQFIIGFIAGEESIALRVASQIVEKKIPTDLVLIVDDLKKGTTLSKTVSLFNKHSIPFSIIRDKQWRQNLKNGHYGEYFQQFSDINSIPLGRTILHHHLYTETKSYEKPVYWIIDDDITFRSISHSLSDIKAVDIFDIINDNIDKTEALIGGISNDPPLPMLSCVRSQLVDYYHSLFSEGQINSDYLQLRDKADYYYDLSDMHCDHLEVPIYHKMISENDLRLLFSGKCLSRPALQKALKAINKKITRRGANTLIFNRDMLHYYPVINLEVDNKHARRGDLVWALLNQEVSNRVIFEHTFTVEHNRPVADLDIIKELDKAAYDIIGYAFTKAMFKSIAVIKSSIRPERPKDVFDKLNQKWAFDIFLKEFSYYIQRRKARFLMNYFRIIGLTKLLAKQRDYAATIYKIIIDTGKLSALNFTIEEALKEETLRPFFKDLTKAIWSYSKSISRHSEEEKTYSNALEKFFNKDMNLRKLGFGAEGIVLTDELYVYKCFFNILDKEWEFLKSRSKYFRNCKILEEIESFETTGFRFIRYPFRKHKSFNDIDISHVIEFIKFCKRNNFVYTNIKPNNFIQLETGEVRLIDYGKSFEPFKQEKLVNSIKRAYLLYRYPKLDNNEFQNIAHRINAGEEPEEIKGWENLWRAVEPRTKEEILDVNIVSLIKEYNPTNIIDYGAGKCKTTRHIEKRTGAHIFVYDINETVMMKRCKGFQKYRPEDDSFIDYFELALLNLVICETDNNTAYSILNIMKHILKPGAILIISVCNPDFAHIHRTEFQIRNETPRSDRFEEVLTKTCSCTGNEKLEYHRPRQAYMYMFKQLEFSLIKEIDTPGIDCERLEPASDFKIFVLRNEI